jgi:hypothetical protein
MGGAIISESGGGIIPLRGAASSRNWGAASSGISIIRPERAVLSGEAGLVTALEKAFRDRKLSRSRATIGQAWQQPGGPNELIGQLNECVPDISADRPPPMVVIPIDQGEELFAADAGQEAPRFLEMLPQVLAPRNSGMPRRPPALAVIAIRADSHERLQTEPLLAHVSPHLFSLPAINPVDYKAVVEGPRDGTPKLATNRPWIRKVPEEEFDFLGYTFGRMFSARTGQARIGYRPSKKSIQRVVGKVHALTDRSGTWQETTTLVSNVNRTLRYLGTLQVSSQLLLQARSNLASNPEQTDAPLNATRSLSSRVSPDGLRLAEPVLRRR